jgi:hypothetical protein
MTLYTLLGPDNARRQSSLVVVFSTVISWEGDESNINVKVKLRH